MADYVDDSCNLTGKTNSCSDISLSSVSFTQTNHPPLCNENHSNDRNAAKQQLSDVSNIEKTVAKIPFSFKKFSFLFYFNVCYNFCAIG